MSEQWNLSDPGAPPPPGGSVHPSALPSSPQPQNGMGVAALVFGILQFICLPIIAAVLAIVFGIMGRKKAKQGLATNGGLATAGLVLGVVGLVLTVISIIAMLILGVGLFAKVNESVDADRNKETGLVDGTYQMAPTTWLVLSDRCSFSGEVMNVESGAMEGSTSVVGSGASECGGASRATIVDFTVSGGIADITSVS